MPVALLGDPDLSVASAVAAVVALRHRQRVAAPSGRRRALRRRGVGRAVLALPGLRLALRPAHRLCAVLRACTSSTSVCWSPPPSCSARCARRRARSDAWQGRTRLVAGASAGRRSGAGRVVGWKAVRGEQTLTRRGDQETGSGVLRLVHQAADGDRLDLDGRPQQGAGRRRGDGDRVLRLRVRALRQRLSQPKAGPAALSEGRAGALPSLPARRGVQSGGEAFAAPVRVPGGAGGRVRRRAGSASGSTTTCCSSISRDLDRDSLLAYAQQIGLDRAAFLACLDSDAPRQAIARDVAEGMRLGIESTPTFFLNGRTITGAPRAERARLRDSARARRQPARRRMSALRARIRVRVQLVAAQCTSSHASRFRLCTRRIACVRTRHARDVDRANARVTTCDATSREKFFLVPTSRARSSRASSSRARTHTLRHAHRVEIFLTRRSHSGIEAAPLRFRLNRFRLRMMFVGCSRRLPLGGGKTTHRAVVVHEVVERGEKWCGGGGLVSSPQLWKATA